MAQFGKGQQFFGDLAGQFLQESKKLLIAAVSVLTAGSAAISYQLNFQLIVIQNQLPGLPGCISVLDQFQI
ncbi:hypothetical protein M2404_003727 [Rheinheimera pacifica]|nr:hypothetical protein [Rheinheimera pacifica]